MSQNVRSGFAAPDNRLYRFVIAGLDGSRISERHYRDHIFELTKKGVYGFILSGGARDEVKSFIPAIRSFAGRPVPVACRMEEGFGRRLEGATEFPSRMAFEAAIDRSDTRHQDILRRALTAIACEAADLGVSLPIIPAPESDQDPSTPPSSLRQTQDILHERPDFYSEWVGVLENMGFPMCAEALPVHAPLSFRAASGRKGTARILILDSSEDGAPETAAAFIGAGTEVLLDSGDPDITVQKLASSLEERRIRDDRAEEALVRIKAAQSDAGEPPPVTVDYPYHEHLSGEISRMAITLVKGRGTFFPVRESDNLPLIYVGDESYFRTSPLRFYVKQASHILKPLNSKERPAVFLVFEDGAPSPEGARPGPEERESVIRLLRASSPSVVVSFGNPETLCRLQEADTLIAAYDTTVGAQEAVFECITGEKSFRGRLPVRLDIRERKGL